MARHTVGFILVEPVGRSDLTQALNPHRDLATIKPDVPAPVALVRQPLVQPITHGSRRHIKFSFEFVRRVPHRQQPGRADDHGVWQAVFDT